MTAREIVEAALVAVCVVVIVFAIKERDAKLEAAAQQKILQEQVDSAQAESARAAEAAAEAARRATEAEDSLAALSGRAEVLSDSLAILVAAAGSSEVQAASDLDSLFAQIRVELPEPARHLVDSAEAKVATIRQSARTTSDAFRAQTESFAAFRAEADSAMGAMRGRAEFAESLAEARRLEVLAERAAKEAAQELATPGVLGRIKTSLPLFSVEGTVAAALGFVAGVATR